MPSITLSEIAKSFGSAEPLNEHVRQFYASRDWGYEEIMDEDRLISGLREFLVTDSQKVGAPDRKDVWLKGWQENLDAFQKDGDEVELVPRFVRPNQIVRWRQKFIQPSNPNFELDFIELFRKWIAATLMSPYDSIYEFGCGSGYNLTAINKVIPNKKMYGCDFVQSSVDLVDLIADETGCDLRGVLFDMTDPDFDLDIDPRSCIFTFGAIEQIPGKFKNFVGYLRQKKPALCMHIEPTVELYDPSNRADQTAIEFHKQRGYTTGFLPHLQELDKAGEISLIKVHRMHFGSLRMEGYNLIIWKP